MSGTSIGTDRLPLLIPRDIHEAMIRHCLAESPLECCGILGGVSREVSLFYPLSNDMKSETRYNADPKDLINAVRDLRDREAEMLAIYHSHPRWEAVPSQADLRLNYYGAVPRIIVSLLEPEPTVRIWRLDPDSYHELAGRLTDRLASP